MKRKPFWVVVCLLVSLALCDRNWAQQPTDSKSAVNPLVRVLQAKGILTAEEVAQLGQPLVCVAGRRRLADLRHFLRGQEALCLQNANERIDGRFVVSRLLRPAAIAQCKGYQQTHHYPKWFPSHLESPL